MPITDVVFIIAGILHGMTGMGFPLIGTSALAFLMPLSQAVALVALPSMLMSLLVIGSGSNGILQQFRQYGQRYGLLAFSSVIGGILGVQLLLILPASWLYITMAAVTLYYAVRGLMALAGRVQPLHVPTGNLSMTVFGLVAGIVGGATNAMSPILLMYLFSKTQDKNEIAKASNLCYLLGKVVQIFMLRQHYLAFHQVQWVSLISLTCAAMLGLLIGIWLQKKISANLFKVLVFLILLVLSLKIGYTGIMQIIT